MLDVCLYSGCGGVCGIGGDWAGDLDQVGLYYVCVSCESGLFV